jgi:hypothetical protein
VKRTRRFPRTSGERGEGGELRLITTLTSFATATSVALAELHLEAFLPADEATASYLRERAQVAKADEQAVYQFSMRGHAKIRDNAAGL